MTGKLSDVLPLPLPVSLLTPRPTIHSFSALDIEVHLHTPSERMASIEETLELRLWDKSNTLKFDDAQVPALLDDHDPFKDFRREFSLPTNKAIGGALIDATLGTRSQRRSERKLLNLFENGVKTINHARISSVTPSVPCASGPRRLWTRRWMSGLVCEVPYLCGGKSHPRLVLTHLPQRRRRTLPTPVRTGLDDHRI